ncbi:unnamed protein product [Paramecium pentaurelia]|uniref:Tetratricopeptide repeat protein n=1 Tax=Paramecium pentaurelia TaxID=43138 RepID=A0A8S1WWF2_9CILI|nr:unnamed protein product [Paramecium pentaurelia]
MKCQQCDRVPITYWCLDNICEKRFVCDQCSKYHGHKEKISQQIQKNKIKTWIKTLQITFLNIIHRTTCYQEFIEENFNQQENLEVLKKQHKLYFQFFQSKPKIQRAILNLNNQLNDIPISNIHKQDDPKYINKINVCKKLLQEKQLFKAQQQLFQLNPGESVYFQIECYILQKKLDDALKLSKETLGRIQENKYLDFNLQIQQAKILHKLKKYKEAIEVLKKVKEEELDQIQKQFYYLQQAKTYQKIIQYQGLGFNTIMNINNQYNLKNGSQIQISFLDRIQKQLEEEFKDFSTQNEDKKKEILEKNNKQKYFIDNFQFSLAIAKANLLRINNDELFLYDNNQNQQQNDQNQEQNNSNQQPNSSNQQQIVQNQQKFTLQDIELIYKEVLKEDVLNQKALFGLSQIYMKQIKYVEAREILYQLCQLNPKNSKAEIGLIYIKQRLLEQKIQDELDSNFSYTENCLSFIFRNFQRFSNQIFPEQH